MDKNTDFTKISEAKLIQSKAKWDPGCIVYLKTVEELCRRKKIKEQRNNRLMILTLRLTIIIVSLTIWNTISPLLFKSTQANDIIENQNQTNENTDKPDKVNN